MRITIVGLAFALIAAGCSPAVPFSDGLTSVTVDETARDDIASEGELIPESATDFYYWDQGFLSDHTTYWSFKCASLEDCQLAVATRNRPEDFNDWEIPTLDFIKRGPADFGDEYKSDKWDLTSIKCGSFALFISQNEKGPSELHFTAIDYDSLRVYRLRWFGDSLTSKLDEIGYNEP